MTAIRVEKYKKHFGGIKAVDGISFSVAKGEIFGFLGPNGAGKTTTIRAMMDFIRPTEGRITLLGQDAQAHSVELKKSVGYLSSDAHLYDEWTGKEHIDFVEALRGKSANVDSLIRRLGFDPSLKVKTLSSGNKQKLNLILALIGNPKLLVLDEPTRGLDPLLQNEIYAMLKEFQQSGGTVFLSSHNLPEVERICGRVGIIRKGKLVAVERIEDLKDKAIHVGHVAFDGAYDKNAFIKAGATITGENDHGFSFTIRGTVNEFLHALAIYRVKDFEMTHSNLEDIFLTYYKD